MKCNHPNCDKKCKNDFCSRLCENHYKEIVKRSNNKKIAVDYLGGKCKRCGFNEDIDIIHFHHLDPCDKKYNISEYIYKDFKFIRAELNKCILLCPNCHTIVHKTKDPKYFIINNYFFSIEFEHVKMNIIADNNDECTSIRFEKGEIKNRDYIIP